MTASHFKGAYAGSPTSIFQRTLSCGSAYLPIVYRHDNVSPFGVKCRRQDLNLHSHYRNQALNLARLPIPPLRRVLRSHFHIFRLCSE